MESFYSFSCAHKKNEVLIAAFQEYDEQALRLGKITPDKPMLFRIDEGKKFYDILHFQDPFNFAVSERIIALLKANNITGWKTFEISISDQTYSYFGFQIVGKCGPLKRPNSSGFVIGYEFEYDSWDKSDFFHPEDSLSTFCTPKVQEIFIQNKIENAEFELLNKIEWYSA